MSTLSWGALILENTKIRGLELSNLAIKIIEIGIRYRIFFSFGAHMSQQYGKEFQGSRGILPFEIVDDPISPVADILFGGDGVEIYYGADQMDSGESLEVRIGRLQSAFNGILELNLIKETILYINPGYGKSNDIEVKIENLNNKMLEVYKKNNNSIPYVKIYILK
jgi:hypothetical protein